MTDANWRKSLIFRKARRYGFNCIRPIVNLLESPDHLPPIVINSFPKSGTHLLLQIAAELPASRDWGLFLASTPSFTFTEVSPKNMARKISGVVANELVCAHLYYSEEAAAALDKVGAVHLFIYRDLRDVAISEAEYLFSMNSWHRLHKAYSKLDSLSDRIDLAINGLPQSKDVDYPNIVKRFGRYKEWLDNDNVLGIRYEDLRGENLNLTLESILDFYESRTNQRLDKKELAKRMVTAISPEKSHTFRSGKVDGWKEILSPDQQRQVLALGEPLLVELGYEVEG